MTPRTDLPDPPPNPADTAARQAWMGVLARAPADDLDRLWRAAAFGADFTWLRAPEVGGVMVQGRMGGTGGAFNLGEMTVTRCTLQLGCGAVGHAYVQGRDKGHAERAALCDALLQTGRAAEVDAQILSPLTHAMEEAARSRAARAAATKVDFFTMVRGED